MRYGLSPPLEPAWVKAFKLAFIAALHVLLIGAVASMSSRPHIQEVLSRFDMRVIEDRPPSPVEPETPKPLPAAPHSMAPRQPAETAPLQPVLTAAETTAPTAPVAFTVAPQSPATEAKSEQLAPPPLSAPRFDAGYLHNPAPSYPLQSRRLKEEGRVLLKVLVSAQGMALTVQVEQGSGHARLDEAAMEAVRQWRFVPAMRGTETVEGWVVVPILFRLDT